MKFYSNSASSLGATKGASDIPPVLWYASALFATVAIDSATRSIL